MVRPRIDLEGYREDIHAWFLAGHTYDQVLAQLRVEGVDISPATLNRRLKLRGISMHPRRDRSEEVDSRLRARICELYEKHQISDAKTLEILQNVDGFELSLWVAIKRC